MRLAPILLPCLLFVPGQAMADTIAIVVRVHVPVVCRTGPDMQPDCNAKGSFLTADRLVRTGEQATGAVIVRSIAP